MAYLQQGIGIWPLLRVDLKRLGEVVFEDIRERLRVIDGRCAICGDEVECLERVLVEIWWFAFDHLCERSEVINGTRVRAGSKSAGEVEEMKR